MFLRKKRVKDYCYIQLVQNRWEDGRSKERVLATLGRLDKLQESHTLEGLLHSASRLVDGLTVLSEHSRGEAPVVRTQRIGAPKIFGRLWEQIGCRSIFELLLADRHFEFPVERAIFLEVLHRLMSPGIRPCRARLALGLPDPRG